MGAQHRQKDGQGGDKEGPHIGLVRSGPIHQASRRVLPRRSRQEGYRGGDSPQSNRIYSASRGKPACFGRDKTEEGIHNQENAVW